MRRLHSQTLRREVPPSSSATRTTHALLFAVLFLLLLAAPGSHYGRRDALRVAAVEASRGVRPVGGPEDDPSRDLKIWIEAGHSFVCPADGSARLPLKVRGVSEGCQPRFSWKVNGGVVEGEGAEIVWNLLGVQPQPGKYYDAVVTVKTGPACGSRKASAIWRACVVCPPGVTLRRTPPPRSPRFCPTISLGTRATAAAGQNVPVTATLYGGTPGVIPKFKWTVLAGGHIDGRHDADSILIEAGKPGQTILAKVEVGGYGPGPPCSATCSIRVSPPPGPTPTPTVLTRVKVTPTSASLGTGTHLFTARAFDQFGRPMAGVAINFESGNTHAATVGEIERDVAHGSATAVVKGHANGTTQIIATGLTGVNTVTSEPVLLTVRTPPEPSPSPTPTPTPSPSPTATPTPVPVVAVITPTPTPAPRWKILIADVKEVPGLPLLLLAALAALAAAGYRFSTRMAAGAATGPASETTAAASQHSVGAAAGTTMSDEVHCTVFAPPAARPGDMLKVQVFAHLKEQAQLLAALAAERDEEAREGGSEALKGLIERGKELTFTLDMPGLKVKESERSLVWEGEPDSVRFTVTVPEDSRPKSIWGTVEILYESVPVGEVEFKFKVVDEVAQAAPVVATPPAEQTEVVFKKAFISYSRKDSELVLEKVQMLEAQGMECYLDMMTFKPGEDWKQNINHYIDVCDVFFLFWSNASKNSAEVDKEIRYAMQRREQAAPRPVIKPIPIEGPPVVTPPPYLSNLHFDDRYRYFIKAKQMERLEASAPQPEAPAAPPEAPAAL